jgi:hypothetical protein
MKHQYLLIPALLMLLACSGAYAKTTEESVTTGVTIIGIFPHFRTQQPDVGSMNSRLIAKTYLKYRSGYFVPIDSVTYRYNNGDRGGFTNIDDPNNDENICFDESYKYIFNAGTAQYNAHLWRKQQFTTDNKVQTLTYTPWKTQLGIWKDSARYVYKYNAGGIMKTSIFQLWFGAMWTDHVLSDLKYDANNNVTEMNSNSYVAKFVYDSKNNLVSMVDSQWTATSGWMYNQRKTYTYNGDDNVLTYTLEKWDPVSVQWSKSELYEYTYSNDLVTEYTLSTWGGSSWVKNTNHLYSYDNNKNKIEDIIQQWDAGSGTFVNKKRQILSYNVHNQPEKIVTMTWYGYWSFSNDDEEIRYYYQYYFPTSVSQVLTSQELTVYPSPATDRLHIKLADNNAEKVTAAIYDYKGSVVRYWQSGAKAGEFDIPVQDLPAGTYVLTVNRNAERLSTRFLIGR